MVNRLHASVADDAAFEEEHFSRSENLDHSDTDLNHSPSDVDRTPSALLPPVQRPHSTASAPHPISKSASTSRMAFSRRPKRSDVSHTRRPTHRDVDSKSGDDVSVPGLPEDQTYSDPTQSANNGYIEVPAPPVVPEGSLKKRVIRIEKTIAEQTAWVRNKFDLDETDTLLDSCSAALVKKIMLQGRLHITSSAMCFYAKIFGSVTKEKWPFSTIHSVRKRRGGFVANSIKITFVNPQTPPVVIASLNRREQTLAIIASRLSVLSPSAIEPASRAGSVDGDSEDHSDGIGHFDAHPRNDRNRSGNRSDRSNCSTPLLSVSDAPSRNSLEGNAARRVSDTTSEDDVELNRTQESVGLQAAVDSLVWLRKGDTLDKVAGKEFEKKIEQVRGTFPVPVILVFNSLFAGDWMISTFLPAINNIDIHSTKWYRDEADGSMKRDVKYRRPLGYRIGPKETRCEETQRYCFWSDGGVLVELENNSLDAPFADYFRVETYLELKPISSGRETELIVSIAIHFSKSTMLRSKIEAGALSESKLSYVKFLQIGKEHLSTSISRTYLDAVLRKHCGDTRKAFKRTAKRVLPDKTYRVPPENPASPEVLNEVVSRSAVPTSVPLEMAPRRAGDAAQASLSMPNVIQMNDASTIQLLPVIGVASLVLVCILLIFMLASIRSMKYELRVLQEVVRELQGSRGGTRIGNTCSR